MSKNGNSPNSTRTPTRRMTLAGLREEINRPLIPEMVELIESVAAASPVYTPESRVGRAKAILAKAREAQKG